MLIEEEIPAVTDNARLFLEFLRLKTWNMERKPLLMGFNLQHKNSRTSSCLSLIYLLPSRRRILIISLDSKDFIIIIQNLTAYAFSLEEIYSSKH